MKKKTGYRVGLALCILGAIMVIVVFWKWLDIGVFTSSNILSELSSSFLNEYVDISLGIGLKIIHYIVIGVLLIVSGLAILILRREEIAVTEGTRVSLECPFCGNRWQEPIAKSHLEAMGYPDAKTLSRRKCSKCAKFIRPKITGTREA